MSLTAVFVCSVRPAALAVATSAIAVHAAAGGGSVRALPCGDANGTRWLVAVTPDGSVCAGNDARSVFRWTSVRGFEALGPSYALSNLGISDDGDTVVGYRRDEVLQRWDAYRWTAAGGMQSLGAWASDQLGEFSYYASGVTGDGAVVVGAGHGHPSTSVLNSVAFRWTESTGMVTLGPLNDPDFVLLGSWAAAVTPDGSTIVGDCSGIVGGVFRERNAVRWNTAGVASALASQVTWRESFATAVSADGSFIAGTATLPDTGYRAIRWDSKGNALDLGVPPGAQMSNSYGISGDGSVVVGDCLLTNGSFSAFVWTESTGIMYLTDFLLANGIGSAGWDALTSASAISRNGRVIVGLGQYQGCQTSFVADLGAACPADLDGSGAVTGVDLGTLLAQWGAPGPADIDGSGEVDGYDLSRLLSAWGPCSEG